MDEFLTLKEQQIRKMQCRPYGCDIKNLPPDTMCAFRAFTRGEIEAYERKHAASINTNKRTKVRYFEIEIPCESNVNDERQTENQQSTIANITAICGLNGQVVYIDQGSFMDLVNKRIEQVSKIQKFRSFSTHFLSISALRSFLNIYVHESIKQR